MSSIPISLQLIQTIALTFVERQKIDGEDIDTDLLSLIDGSLASYLASIQQFPVSRWLALCEGIGPEPSLIAAATHCNGFTLQHSHSLLAQAHWQTAPWREAHIAWQFCKTDDWSPDGQKPSLASLLQFSKNSMAVATFFLGAWDHYPDYDLDKTLHEIDGEIASYLLFFMARDGLDEQQTKLLFDYVKHLDAPIEPRFWAHFTAILRFPHLHEQISLIEPLVADDPIRRMAADALIEAIGKGPLTADEALWLHEIHTEGPSSTRLARSLRLAAFVPGSCPMIDVFAPWSKQEKQAEGVKAAIDQAIASGASFTPAAYLEKARHANALKTEADKRAQKLKERMEPRGWNEAMITEALASGPGVPVTGYPYGTALLRFHPVSGFPIVSCAETGEVIHVGRADYVYNVDTDARNALPEDERPKLPPFREIKPSAPDLETIYVHIKDEWIDVWRPVAGRWMERNVYVLMPREIPQDEAQEFWIAHHVECTIRRFGTGIGQTATKLVQPGW